MTESIWDPSLTGNDHLQRYGWFPNMTMHGITEDDRTVIENAEINGWDTLMKTMKYQPPHRKKCHN